VLQHTGAHCNTLQHTAKYCICKWLTERGLGVAKHCNTLQHTATHCNTLQHTIYISGLRSVGSVLPSIAAPPKISTSARRIWGVLQCVVVLCSVLQCVLPGATKDLYERASHLQCAAVRCTLLYMLRCVAVCCGVFWCALLPLIMVPPRTSKSDVFEVQHAAAYCNTLQYTAIHCHTLQHSHPINTPKTFPGVRRIWGTTQCITLQHTATHCTLLQHTATHCNILQRIHPPHTPQRHLY